MKKYDLFISHASEDKDQFVRPFANRLKEIGLSVWYDEFSLSVGDSLSESIDKGLLDSEFALVILSSHFFNKNWPKRELGGLVARETIENGKIIIPVWYKVSKEEVLNYSPTLADKVSISTNGNFEPIINAVLKLIARPKWSKSSLVVADYQEDSKKLAKLTNALLGLQDLNRIASLFPEVSSLPIINTLYENLVLEIDSVKGEEHFKDIFVGYEKPTLLDDEAFIKIAFLILLVVSHCLGGEKVFVQSDCNEVLKSRVNALYSFLPEEFIENIKKITELKLFYCNVPDFKIASYALPERRIAIVLKYWELLRAIIVYQVNAPIGHIPHPLSRFIISLQKRIHENFDSMEINGNSENEFISIVDSFCEGLLSGDPDWSGVEEYINSQIAKAQYAIEQLRMEVGPLPSEFTEPEEVFLSTTLDVIKYWKANTNARWEEILNRIKNSHLGY